MLLRLIAANLIENAIAYSPAGGEVLVRLTRSGTSHTLSVVDVGPGIPAEERGRVLERFYRGPGAAAEGSGLGLAIVDQAVRLLGGRFVLGECGDGATGLYAMVELPSNGADVLQASP
jgi:signal transduction histidine kinase